VTESAAPPRAPCDVGALGSTTCSPILFGKNRTTIANVSRSPREFCTGGETIIYKGCPAESNAANVVRWPSEPLPSTNSNANAAESAGPVGNERHRRTAPGRPKGSGSAVAWALPITGQVVRHSVIRARDHRVFATTRLRPESRCEVRLLHEPAITASRKHRVVDPHILIVNSEVGITAVIRIVGEEFHHARLRSSTRRERNKGTTHSCQVLRVRSSHTPSVDVYHPGLPDPRSIDHDLMRRLRRGR
jgi:hypothetical protein